jgi:SAM-dependent methyltransferase
MNLDKLYIKKFHEAKIEKYGSANAQSLGWFSKESQLKRFDMLTGIGDLNNSSVLDIGCGNGDLCYYLSQKFTNVNYSGIDLVDAFLNNAIELNKHCASATFYSGNFMDDGLPVADYVFACGSLNYKSSDPDFIYKAISGLYKHCNIAFGFNLLSETINPDGILAAYSPQLIIDHCKTLSSNVILRTGYEEGDFTIWICRSCEKDEIDLS